MDESMVKEMVNEHWRYNEALIRISYKNREMISKSECISMMEYLYTKAMIHGIKHGKEDGEE